MAYAVGPKNRVYFTQPAMEEQLRYLGEAWMQIHPNLRRKHIGAALRRVGNRHVAPEYRSAARFFEGNEGYRGQYRSGVTKSGKASFRRMAGNLRRSVGGSKVYPAYPRDSALDMKFGYRMGRFGGSHAMLLDQGTKPRFRKGRFGAIQHAERHARLRQMLKSGVGKRSKRPITGGTIRNALKTSHAARYWLHWASQTNTVWWSCCQVCAGQGTARYGKRIDPCFQSSREGTVEFQVSGCDAEIHGEIRQPRAL